MTTNRSNACLSCQTNDGHHPGDNPCWCCPEPSELTPENATRIPFDHGLPKFDSKYITELDPVDCTRPKDDSGSMDINCPHVRRFNQQLDEADVHAPGSPLNPLDLMTERQMGRGSRSSIDLAMDRTDDLPAVADPRNPVALQQGQNPYIAAKEKIIDEVVSSKYSLRRGLIRPERGRVLVARTEWDEQLGSIFLTGDTKDQHTATNMEVVVMACGKNRVDPSNGREMHMEYEPDDTIGRHAIIRQHSGLEFIWYDENGKQRVLYLIGQSEIWSWLEPPPEYEKEMQNSPELQRTLKYIKSGLAQKALPNGCACSHEILDGHEVRSAENCPVHGEPR